MIQNQKQIEDIFSLTTESSLIRSAFKEEINLRNYKLPLFVPDKSYTSQDFFIKEGEDTMVYYSTLAEICRQGMHVGKQEKFYSGVLEAFRNAYQHGNKKNPKKKINVSHRVDLLSFEVVVSDQGGILNPDFVPFVLMHRYNKTIRPYSFYHFSSNTQQNSENAGIGTYIIHSVADEVNYFSNKSKGLSLQMIIRKNIIEEIDSLRKSKF